MPITIGFLIVRDVQQLDFTAPYEGAAGLLPGRRATTDWLAHELLAAVGVTPHRRPRRADGRFFTAGGVTARIDDPAGRSPGSIGSSA